MMKAKPKRKEKPMALKNKPAKGKAEKKERRMLTAEEYRALERAAHA